jgi:hypothetical protein
MDHTHVAVVGHAFTRFKRPTVGFDVSGDGVMNGLATWRKNAGS